MLGMTLALIAAAQPTQPDILLPRGGGTSIESTSTARTFHWRCSGLRARAETAASQTGGLLFLRLYVNDREIPRSRSGEALALAREMDALDNVAFYCARDGRNYTFHLIGRSTWQEDQGRYIAERLR